MCDRATVRMTICMGSSCFARGNRAVLRAVQSHLAAGGLEARVELVGSRCEGRCAEGPNILLDDTPHQDVDPGSVLDLLRDRLART